MGVSLTYAGPVEDMKRQAKSLQSFVKTKLAKEWLAGVEKLEPISPRTLYATAAKQVVTPSGANALPADQQDGLKEIVVNDSLYYYTKYGSPLAYCRAIDLVAAAGFELKPGSRVLDFGYGGIGTLRLWAESGAAAVGVDVDPLLKAMYSEPGDTGKVGRGFIQLVEGRWPAESKAVAAIGGEYDLFISKNTLKRGYVHPERLAPKAQLIDLGVDDTTYLKAIWTSRKPGGFAMIYNLCPKQAPPDKPFIPWADGRCPFERADIVRTGFEILAFDVKDDKEARAMGKHLEWDKQGMDLDGDLFATYTLLRRPVAK